MKTLRRELLPALLLALGTSIALGQDAQPSQPAAPAKTEAQPPKAAAPARQGVGLKVPEGVKALRDQVYAKVGDRELKLDLYLPREAQAKEGQKPEDLKPVPLVIWIHGGGWRGGTKAVCPTIPLTEQGFAAASVEYRFTNEATFPAQIHDCKSAVRWLRAHAKEFHLDTERFGAWGASAGGHLVALLGTSGGVKDEEGDVGGNLEHSSRVQAVCDWFGPTDLVAILGPGAATADQAKGDKLPPAGQLVTDFLGGWPKEKPDLYRLANPINFVSKDDPPFLIMHGDEDPLVPLSQSEELEKSLEKAGVPTKLHVVKGGKHGFSGKDEMLMVKEFFLKQLGGPAKDAKGI